jgi:flavodoxin
MKTLVVYYSYEGHTKLIAETIAEELKADIERLVPAASEKERDGFSKYMWGGAQVSMRLKPQLNAFVKNPMDYDVVFVGSPIWAWSFTPAIRTLFEDKLLTGKSVYFFCTHEGGLRGAMEKTKALIEKNNRLLGWKDFLGVEKFPVESQAEAKRWVASLVRDGLVK